MSGVIVDVIESPTGFIDVVNNSKIKKTNSIAQMSFIRADVQATYSSSNSGNGTTVTDLNHTFTPLYNDSILLIEWVITGEMHQDNVWLIHKDGSLITLAGYEGYNNEAGNVRYSGVMSAYYDQNENSTPYTLFLQYTTPAEDLTERTYAPAVRSSSSGNYTLYLNRTQGSLGANNYEIGISTGVITEIMQ